MSLITSYPFTFVNGTGPGNIADATQVNANFTTVQTAVNNIYPSQVLPLTTAQATFGGATGFGYSFPGALNVDGSTGGAGFGIIGGGTSLAFDLQSVGTGASGGMNFFVPIAATNGFKWATVSGNTLMTLNAAGALVLGNNTTNTTALTANMFASQSVTGLIINGAAGITGNLFECDLTPGGTTVVSVNRNGTLTTTLGYITTGITPVTAGAIGTGTNGTLSVFDVFSASGNWAFRNNVSANQATINSSGVYTPVSDQRLKENVAPIALGLAEILKLNPVSYDWIKNKENGQGFIAQEVQQVIPLAVSVVDEEIGILGISDALLTPVVVKAMQEFYAEFKAYEAAHP